MLVLRALLGLAAFCLFAWLVSSHRRRFPWRIVLGGLALQIALGLWTLTTGSGQAFFGGMAEFVRNLIGRNADGASLVFGPLADPGQTIGTWGDGGVVFAFASSGLIAIVFFSALLAVLYHLGVMQVLVWLMARVLRRVMGVSGAEAMAMSANVFVGQTEAPLAVRPYLKSMTLSELNALMTGGFATIAGSVLAIYMGFVGEALAPHLLTASVMSAPAAFVMAKIMLPETEQPATAGLPQLRVERQATNILEAAAVGTMEGGKLFLTVAFMLVAFTGLVSVVDWPLNHWGTSLRELFGYLFAPVAWVMGIEGWHDCQVFGSMLGFKVAVNEFVAFSQLENVLALAPADGGFVHERSKAMVAYALCGFANFASIGIQIGGISTLVPERRADLSKLALRAMAGGACASWMTATVAGMFV